MLWPWRAEGECHSLPAMERSYKRLAGVLGQVPNVGLQWSSEIHDGHTHVSVVAPASNDALLYLFRK
jgi:hypothetical protein